MIAVAIIGIVVGVQTRWASFRRRAAAHAEESLQRRLSLNEGLSRLREDDPAEEAKIRAAVQARRAMLESEEAYHERMRRYYEARW
jgi:hypothetical protein